jgi:hypothetical protein
MGIKEAAVSDARSILIGFFPCPMTADAPLGETPWRKPLPKGEDRTASSMPNAPCPMPIAPCPMPYYLIPILFFFFAATFVNLRKVVDLAGFLIKFRFRQTPLLQDFI